VIEDEETLRIAVSKLLGKAGISVIEAADGSSALERIRSEAPIDVVILDLTIPGASSAEVFAETMRLRPEAKIFVTSAHPREFATRSLDGPVLYFIRKPYRVADVLAMIRQATVLTRPG
jgi:DNA-binding NtrC family response regulator